jgi:hypothetical protein
MVERISPDIVSAIEQKLLSLNARWAADGGPFDGEWVPEVMALVDAPTEAATPKDSEERCEITNASSMSAATSPDQATKIKSANSSNAPATELPESVRIPLHSLQADLGYLIGRVIADGSCGSMVIQSMRERLDLIEVAFRDLAQQVPQPPCEDYCGNRGCEIFGCALSSTTREAGK